MKIGILHLSDIHLRSDNDIALGFSECIAQSSYQTAHGSDAFIIMVTGDIAFGGKESEYKLAKKLIASVKGAVERETNRPVHVVVAPGNHDCDLVPENPVRKLIIDNIVASPSLAKTKEYVDVCAGAQENFFKFQDDVNTLDLVFLDKLWAEYELCVGGGILRVSALNAAWMSTLKEAQGQLVFPVDDYMGFLESPANLRISLIHHPLNWYCQSSYHPLKKALRTHCNAVLSGHEHSVGSEEIIDSRGLSTLVFEAPALSPHEKDREPGFCCLLLDVTEKTAVERKFIAAAGVPKQIGDDVIHSLKVFEKGGGNKALHAAFVGSLSDPGGNFTHPDCDLITAEDIFLYPELQEGGAEFESKSVYADEVINSWEKGSRYLIVGEDESGKTFLLQRAFMDLHAQGGFPLYIKSSELGSVSDRELDKMMQAQAGRQYVDKNDFIYSGKELKIALVDDIDRVPGGAKNQAKLVSYLEERFGAIFLTANSRYQLSELVDTEISDLLSGYGSYSIRPFGHVMRHKLIKKWCLLGDVSTKSDLDRKVHDVERLLNLILGKNLVPSKPIYILILLQSSVLQQQGELQNSSFSYYYEYLIIKSLKDAGFKSEYLGEMFNYLSQLAWFFKENDAKELDSIKLRKFNRLFSDEFTSVDFEQRVSVLCRAKILAKSGDMYRFNYSYIYYLFVGKYLASNLHKFEIKALVESYCSELYRKDNANFIMFLTHHSSDPWVMEQVSTVLKKCFSRYSPLEFNGDIDSINEMVESAAQIIIGEIDVDGNQLESRRIADEIDSDDVDDDLPESAKTMSESDRDKVIELSSNMNLMIKTSEILGSITKNYYGSIERRRKQDYLCQIFDGTLRSLKSLFEEIVDQPDAFVSEVERIIEDRSPNMREGDRKDQAKKFAFQMVGLICTGFIAKTAEIVSSDKIREDISRVVESSPNNAYRLLGVATALVQPGNIPFDDIERLAKDLAGNNFAFTILQSLVFWHLHMFHTSDKDKQRIAASVKISMQQSRAIDISTQKTKVSKT